PRRRRRPAAWCSRARRSPSSGRRPAPPPASPSGGMYTIPGTAKGGPMDADDLILISVDDHICEPADMFDAHVPARWKDQAPKVVVDGGKQRWMYGDRPGRDLGLNAVAGKPRELFNIDACRYDEM